MRGTARLDRIAGKLRPRRRPDPEWDAFLDDLPGAVSAYVRAYSLPTLCAVLGVDSPPASVPASAIEPAAALVAEQAGDALVDVCAAIAVAAFDHFRAPTLAEVQAVVIAGVARRLAAAMRDEPPTPPPASFYSYPTFSNAAALELVYGDSETFGPHTIYTLSGKAFVDHWRAGHTEDVEILSLAGLGPAELALLGE